MDQGNLKIRRVLQGRLYLRELSPYGFVTRAEAAEILQVSVRWIAQLIVAGRFRVVRRGRRVLIPARQVLSHRRFKEEKGQHGNETRA